MGGGELTGRRCCVSLSLNSFPVKDYHTTADTMQEKHVFMFSASKLQPPVWAFPMATVDWHQKQEQTGCYPVNAH